jgi:cobalt-zinc-cadmium efflux system outer membrane protein
LHRNWRSCASASAIALLSTMAAAFAADPAARDAPTSLPSPLSADAFIAAVLAHNASLEASREAVLAAIAKVKPAGTLDDPMVSASVAPRTFGALSGIGADVEVSQTLPWWGTLDARAAAARAEAEAASHDSDALKLRLAAVARGLFSDWIYLHRAFEINLANESLLTELRNTARIRYAAGQGAEEDVLQADVERAMLREARLELEREQTSIQARMNALLDRDPHASIPDPSDLPAPPSLPAEEMLAQHVLAHPQLQMLEAEQDSAEAEERLAAKERYPTFTASAGYNSMWSDPAMRPMVGLSFTVPTQQGRYRADADAARARARRAAATLDDQRATALSDLAADYAAALESARSLALYRDELVPLVRSTLEVARTEYGSGRGDFLNILTAERHRLDTELGLARIQSQYFEQLAELERASGGGVLTPLRISHNGTSDTTNTGVDR